MFTVKEIIKDNYKLLQIIDKKTNTKAILNLSLGASLQELILSNKKIIEDITETYKTTYSSAILFPFVNRVDDGKYNFNNKEYQLDINEPAQNNSIHGLVYNKEFSVSSKKITSEKVTIFLEYIEIQKQKGFPFTYKIKLAYTFTASSIELKATIKNTDKSKFPFTIGWHPYFYSSDLSKSIIHFKSDKTIEFNNKSITKEIINENKKNKLILNHKNFDDCYSLADNKVFFETPQYAFELDTDEPNTYLQIYTPENLSMVAIEPQTGVSDSFNNKESLKILDQDETYSICWQMNLINQKT